MKYLEENQDKNLDLSASVDSFGEEEYNNNLALKRAKNAINLFPKSLHERINILEKPIQNYDNSNSIGRIKNRTVAIIFNK